jgi:hypothetical protein
MHPPGHLSDHCRTLWQELTASFLLDPTELELLRLALEAMDRCEQARTRGSISGRHLGRTIGWSIASRWA